MRSFSEYLLANNLRIYIAVLILALIPLPPIFGMLVGILIGFVTLQKGSKIGLAALAFVALPMLAKLVLHQFDSSAYYYDNTLVEGFFVWLMASALQSGWRWYRIVEALTLVGIIVVVSITIFFPTLKQYWFGYLLNVYKQYSTSGILPGTTPQILASLKQLAPLLTGYFVFYSCYLVIIQLMLARYWQSVFYKPGLSQSELSTIPVTSYAALLAVATVVIVAMRWLPSFAPVSLMLMLPVMVSGLSVLHYWAAKNRRLYFFVGLGYIVVLLFSTYGIFLVSLLGLLDKLLNIRKLKRGQHESHTPRKGR